MIQSRISFSRVSRLSQFYGNLRKINTINSFFPKRSLRTTTLSNFQTSLQKNDKPQTQPHPLGPKDENPYGIGPTHEKPHTEGHTVNKAKDFSGDDTKGLVGKVKEVYNKVTTPVDVQAESASRGLEEHESKKGNNLQDKFKEVLGTAQEKAKETVVNNIIAKETIDNIQEIAKQTVGSIQDKAKVGYETVKEKSKETLGVAQEKTKQNVSDAKETAKETFDSAKDENEKILKSTKEKGQEILKGAQEKSQESLQSGGEKARKAMKMSQEKGKDLKETSQDVLKKAQESR